MTYTLNSIGVKTHVLSPYSGNLGRNSDDFYPELIDYEKLFEKVDTLNLNIKIDHPRVDFVTLRGIECLYEKKEGGVCSAGIDGFIVGPDGNACICERLTYSGYSLGNVKEKSLMDIWNSEEIQHYYNPSIELFKDSKCYYCDEKEYCINRRGICYVHSLILNNNIYSPDNFCKYNDHEKRIY